MTNKDFNQEAADLRQQVMALASIIGVLIAALRKGGLMTADFEALGLPALAVVRHADP